MATLFAFSGIAASGTIFTMILLPIIRHSPWSVPLLAVLLAIVPVRGTEVVQWGDSSRTGAHPGPTNPPPDLRNAVAVAGGFYHSIALTIDGTVIAWGSNRYGETNVPPDLTNVVAIAAGAHHNLAVTHDGNVVAWGRDTSGQSTVPDGLSNVVQVAAGEEHSVALCRDGKLVAWGRFALNTNDVTNIPTGLTNCITIAAGAFHCVGISAEGRVFAWGNPLRTNVPPGLSNVVAVTAGRDATIALTVEGRLVVWPDVPPLSDFAATLTNVVQVSMERLWSVVLLRDGAVVAGGAVPLDYGHTNVPAGLTNVLYVAAGRYHGLAITDSEPVVYSFALPLPQVTTAGGSLAIPTQRGRLYVVEKSATLAPGSWTIEDRVAGDGTPITLVIGREDNGFYRVRRVP